MRRGLAFVILGIAIIPAWIGLLNLAYPNPAMGAAIRTVIVGSIIPFILAAGFFGWGLTDLMKTWASRSRRA